MAEDQGVNGDIWNDQATRLFKRAGWQKIADSNIDLPGADGVRRGIDSLFVYEDGFNPKIKQGVFLEAKRYSVKSFSKSQINDWIITLDSKIRLLRQSQEFLHNYPFFSESTMTNGLIAIWFHDLKNQAEFKEKFYQLLSEINIPKGRGSKFVNIRLFILENDKILRLASLLDTVDKSIRENGSNSINFYYPSSARFGNPVQELSVVNLEYMFSQFVLAKSKKVRDNIDMETTDIVFYFGRLDINSFFRLREALLAYDMINKQNRLVIYKYHRNDEFRKIQPDVIKLFEDKSPREVKIRDMEIFSDLPTWMTNE
jgi:hypothetical protein